MSTETTEALPPIHITAEATRALSEKVRAWTGWPTGVVRFGETENPAISPVAICNHDARRITVNPEYVLLNPNRVLLTVTPFRLRQEAVLTGTLLHEAGHARHSLWILSGEPPLHGDGTPVQKNTLALARLIEEPRIEGRIAAEVNDIGAAGLDWTMRAMAAYLLPMTEVSTDPAQAVMDVLSSWILRAGRQIALAHHLMGYRTPNWVAQFTALLHSAIQLHVLGNEEDDRDPTTVATEVGRVLSAAFASADDIGSTVVDAARDVLALLFPETDADDQPQPSGGCGAAAGEASDRESESESGEGGEGDEEGEQGEGNTEPEDEGSGEDPGAGDSGDDEAEPEDGEGDEQGEGDESGSEGASPSTADKDEAAEQMAEALALLEQQAKSEVTDEAEDEAEKQPPGQGAGAGTGGALGGAWKTPTPEQREVQRNAERFLRNLLDASETSVRSITDQPSAAVDGAALTAWRAGGQRTEPRFFIRTQRRNEPAPPVRIAILVDVSSSMDMMQAPSSLLSWALGSAALDLRNFAGRGQQVESCLIHWGDSVRVIQKPGEVLPGLRTASCHEGTSNMHGALAEVEWLMPGFFDITATPVNRLLVQFTDWKIFHPDPVVPYLSRGLEAGVNMLSVVPSNYAPRYTRLDEVLAKCPIKRGHTTNIKYNPSNPEAVWSQATEMLTAAPGEVLAPFPGF